MRRRSSDALALAALALAIAAGCAATRKPAPATLPSVPCPAAAAQSTEAAICARDTAIRTLRARFRADVQAAGTTRTAEGVLVWRAPGALRVKLFTLAGLTVYDALLVGDAERVRGVVRQPLSGSDATFDLGPGETLTTPDADLSLVLWSLWQSRCARPPAAIGGDPSRQALDPAPARGTAREVVVADGEVREEILTRTAASGTATERVVARYTDYDCAATPPALPRHIEVEAPASGWRAQVTIVEQATNIVLDEGLFVLPAAASGDGKR